MHRKLILLIFVTLFTFINTLSGTAQTRDELEQKYGAPDVKGHYLVRPDIRLSVKYEQNQNPSEMIIEPLDLNTMKVMPSDAAQEVLDELVPAVKRVKKKDGFSFLLVSACRSAESTEYEQFTISIAKRCKEQGGGIFSINIRWKTDKNIYRVSAFDSHAAKKGCDCEAMQNFFLDALISANKPGGLMLIKNSCFENIVFPENKSDKLSFDKKLKLINKLNSNYSVKDEEGVINLSPTQSAPELLKVKIHNVKITFDNNLNLLIDTLLEQPEVIDKLKELKLREGMQFGGLQSPPNHLPPTEMAFKDKTLQEILNDVVKKRGRGVWVYREFHYNGEDTFDLDFPVK